MSIRLAFWIALGGLVLGLSGVVWDGIWHNRHPGELAGVRELFEAHWLIIVGILIIFGALSTAVRSVSQPRSSAISTWIAFVGSVSMVVGLAWDSARHVQGAESPSAHAMVYGGLILVVVGLPAALVLGRHLREPRGTKRD